MLFFFSASTVCVSFRGRRNVLVYLRSVLALNGLGGVFYLQFSATTLDLPRKPRIVCMFNILYP